MKKKEKYWILIFITAGLADLLMCILLKYNLNNVKLSEFDPLNAGNLLLLTITILFVSGIIVSTFLRDKNIFELKYTILTFCIVAVLSCPVAYVIENTAYFPFDGYLLGYPFKKLLLGVILITGKFSIIYLVGLLWNSIFNDLKLIRLRSSLYAVIILMAMMVFSFLRTLNNDVSAEIKSDNNLGIVFGAAVWSNNKPSPLFQARILKSYELYRDSLISDIQLTGANAPGELSEAEAAFSELVNMGVDRNHLKIEKETSNTSEQMRFIFNNKNGYLNDYKNIILISDAFHLPRIVEICRFFKINAVTTASDYNLSWEKLLYYQVRESIALLLFWLFGI
ncbi:MAG: YdcF family protein [Melioribacteraceae bacterium]|nr:YdcF family protein [Melioribacteraceae bacterium]